MNEWMVELQFSIMFVLQLILMGMCFRGFLFIYLFIYLFCLFIYLFIHVKQAELIRQHNCGRLFVL
jgi:hypothetical protein